MKGIISLEKGRRYELSFWYKTVNRERNASLSIFSSDVPLAAPVDIDADKLHRFFELGLEPTHGEWKQVTRTLTPSKDGTYVIQLASYYHKEGEWTWWDEVEIRKVW